MWVMDANSLLSPEWRSELQFQLSLLRLLYPKTSLVEGAAAQLAQLEQVQLQESALLSAVRPFK
jgi:hypothetical protein